MYINNKKRKLDLKDLDTVANADYFTCVYYQSQGKSLRSEFNTYKEAYLNALVMLYNSTRVGGQDLDKRKFMFYAVKSTSQCHIGGLK